MDDRQAKTNIENYLTGRGDPAGYQAALDYLTTSSSVEPGLARLYRDLTLPGGLDHAQAQEIMPYFLEPLARARLPVAEKEQLLAHLALCEDCAAFYRSLSGFELEVAHHRQARAVRQQAGPAEWQVEITQFRGLFQNLRFKVQIFPTAMRSNFEQQNLAGFSSSENDFLSNFSPEELKVAETKLPYNVKRFTEPNTLIIKAAGNQPELEISARIERQAEADWNLKISLNNAVSKKPAAGYTASLQIGENTYTQTSNRRGEVSFKKLVLEQSRKNQFELKIKLNLEQSG